ncbi:MAG: hypothetical protein WKG01_22960 [Kofleriaceae bacterium]
MIASPSPCHDSSDGCLEPTRNELLHLGWQLAGGGASGPPPAWIAICELVQASARVLELGDEVGSARHLAAARAQVAQLRDGMSPELEREIASLLEGHREPAGAGWLALSPAELRAIVEHRTARTSGARASFAAMIGARAAGGSPARIADIAHCAGELGIAQRMAEALIPQHDDLRALRPSWAWVWTAEVADAPSWVRLGRWARQISRTGADPTPLAQLLQQFAARHGVEQARARIELARRALDRIHP